MIPFFETAFFCYLIELVQFLFAEKKAFIAFRALREESFRLAGKETMFIAFLQYVGEHRLEVFRLGATVGERAGVEGFGMDDLKKEVAGVLLSGSCTGNAPHGGQGTTHHGSQYFVEKAQAISFVIGEWKERRGGGGFGRGVALLVHGGVWG